VLIFEVDSGTLLRHEIIDLDTDPARQHPRH
jgi:hypothetical protein